MLDTRGLLERLCQLTTDVLNCSCSHTLIRVPEQGVYVPVASAGDLPQDGSLIREIRIPVETLRDLLSALRRDKIACITAEDGRDLPAAILYPSGTTVAFFMALHGGPEACAIQTASYRGRSQPIAESEMRAARAFAGLAALALEYAGLVDELDRIGRSKSEFVATISHELRTPLHVILGYNDLLLEGVLGALTPEQTESLQHMGERARELLHLITTTLDLAGLRHTGAQQDVNVADLIGELEAEFCGARACYGPTPVWKLGADIPTMRTDRAKLKVVIERLVDNAIKFTAPEGEVRVDVLCRDGMLEVTVSDTGVGMSEEVVATLFEPFREVESGPERGQGTVGLGLYSVRRLLDGLGGRITVESTVGSGSTFRFGVPADFIAAACLSNSGDYPMT